jgi:hypothetical protein
VSGAGLFKSQALIDFRLQCGIRLKQLSRTFADAGVKHVMRTLEGLFRLLAFC